ncbi:glycerophosphodiester phosphodiesterase family protein [Sphingomonas sp. CFBP 8760]|uniref:glycerophosphodiester phosphodiesterase family protein n=1 Tax=Sphingomonas sp. CFBP 8760 TaxID=2775282 RepID=UPI001785EC27|nr:glycerophosphodiester phosphodiesterase family protein [Sphingomonas sp. CFBP 8760]MBD8548998.1 glycerophosphodiester phosphodiesterase family protein [Sphingomonas sp. CFBP 8760]
MALTAATPAAAQSCRTIEERFGEIMGYRQTKDVMILGHRGYWSGYNPRDRLIPENSTGAIEAANNACIDGVELDIKMSADGVPYIMHDFNVGRTTNFPHLQQRRLYNPYADGTNADYNPRVASLSAGTIDRLRLLRPNRVDVSPYTVPRLSGVLQTHMANRWTIPLIFDVKTSDAVRATNSLVRALVPGGRYKMAMKVNATLYQTPGAFEKDAPDMWAIPVFTTNMLGIIHVDNAFNAWFTANAIEVNVKQPWGLMYTLKDRVVDAGKKAAVFHALADENKGNGNFFRNTGECCYKLSDIYYNWKPGFKDTDDRRGNLDFLNGERYGLVTTDDPNGTAKFYRGKGKRANHPGQF